MMIIGVPKEIKDNEYRVAMTPGGVKQLSHEGHEIWIQHNAGKGSGFTDQAYEEAGAKIVADAVTAWRAEMVVKVKEPLASEFKFLRADLTLFTYLHLAAEEELTKAMMASGVTGIAYETVELANGHLPLLQPMSEVAGRMASQIGAYYLEKMNGGRGKLMSGIPGVRPADVAIIGGGTVGTNAAKIALGLGANVSIIDINLERLRYLDDVLGGRISTIASNPVNVAKAVQRADLVIGAVLVKGARAPKLVSREMISAMKPGSVVVDVAVDQGGCIATTRATTHSNPTFLVDGVVHYCVSNMPGAVPRTSTYGLNNATLPYMVKLANLGALKAISQDPALAKGVNTYQGHITYPAVAKTFGLPCKALETLI